MALTALLFLPSDGAARWEAEPGLNPGRSVLVTISILWCKKLGNSFLTEFSWALLALDFLLSKHWCRNEQAHYFICETRGFPLDPTGSLFPWQILQPLEMGTGPWIFFLSGKCSRTNLKFLISLFPTSRSCLFILWFSLLCKSLWLCLGPICLFLLYLFLLPLETGSKCWKTYNLYWENVLPLFYSRVVMVLYFIFALWHGGICVMRKHRNF